MSGRGFYRGGRDGGRGRGASRGGGGRSDGGRGRGRGDRGGGRGGGGRGGRGPAGPETVSEVLTNIVKAGVMESFDFFLIGIDAQDRHGEQIESASRSAMLFYTGLRKLMENLPKEEKEFYLRTTFAQGSHAFSSRRIPGLEEGMVLVDGSSTEGDSLKIANIERFTAPECLAGAASPPADAGQVKFDQFRCQGCAKTFPTYEQANQHWAASGGSHGPIIMKEDDQVQVAETAPFLSYVNSALQRAMGEELVRWGQDYFDPKEFIEDWGLKIYRAISLSFSVAKIAGKKTGSLILTCDLKSKVMRCNSLLNELNPKFQKKVPESGTRNAKKWINEAVIYKSDRKRYNVIKLHFDQSPDTLLIPGTKKSHTEYFASKNITLEYPHCPPMVEVKGHKDKTIFLPPELVVQYELDPKSRMKLPQIASYDPPTRHEAINKALSFLTPGKSKSIGGTLLPALGIVLEDKRVKLTAKTLSFPKLVASADCTRFGVNFKLPSNADYKVDPKQVTRMNVVLFCNEQILDSSMVYNNLRDMVNGMNSKFSFPEKPFVEIETNDIDQHFGAVEKFFSSDVPPNVFVLDFAKPRAGALDMAYPVVKMTLGQGGYLSQFVNWKTCAHDEDRNEKKSRQILDGIARQILQKAGACLWYVTLPPQVPMPAMFLGIDVFHAPIVFDPKTKTKGRKSSVVALVFSIIEKSPQQGRPIVARTYTRTYRRNPGEEFNLRSPLQESTKEAIAAMKMRPSAVFVYRDGMNASSVSHEIEEIEGIRAGLKDVPVGGGPAPQIPLAYISCQKRIANKFLTTDGQFAAPPGTMITGIQGMQNKTFYINSTAPKGSTGKPTRFELVRRDKALATVPIEILTYHLCYTYPNWTGQIKVPGPVQCAHKAAELAGCMFDAGESINAKSYTNTMFYL